MPTRNVAMVTVGTDGFVDYVQVPDGQKFMLGPVSVLRLITGSAGSMRSARVALKEFVESGKTMLSVDLDKMWALLPFRRARYSSANPLIEEQERVSWKRPMKSAAKTLSASLETAEVILSKVAETNASIDRLVDSGKRFDSVRAKGDLLRLASKVSDVVRSLEVAPTRMGRELAELEAQATEIYELFPRAGE